jgi:hypothetical protein
MNNYPAWLPGAALPGILAGWLGIFLIPVTLWSLFWMGWALWRAAKDDSKVWYVILLLVHTMGILDIIYIFLVSKKAQSKSRK